MTRLIPITLILIGTFLLLRCGSDPDPAEAALTITTLAGGTKGKADGKGSAAKFSNPQGLDIDAAGNIYVADYDNHRVCKVTPDGVVTTVAGTTMGYLDGTVTDAKLYRPIDIAVDKDGNIFVSEYGNNKIRKIDAAGHVTTVANVVFPGSIVVDKSGNLFVTTGNEIIKITPNGDVLSYTGDHDTYGFKDGDRLTALFSSPSRLAIDENDNLYITDRTNNRIRKIAQGEVTTVAGSHEGYEDGPAVGADFTSPFGIGIDHTGNIYVNDVVNPGSSHSAYLIRRISPEGMVTTVAGGEYGFIDGHGSEAKVGDVHDFAINEDNVIYILDSSGNSIRRGILE